MDIQTGSDWNFEGVAINGELRGNELIRLPYDEGFCLSGSHFNLTRSCINPTLND